MLNLSGVTMMAALEYTLSLGLTTLFFARGWHRQFKAMGAYLVVRLLSGMALMPLLLHVLPLTQEQTQTVYFYGFWMSYLVSSVLLFIICVEILRSVFEPFSHLAHYGLVGLRWMVALFSILVIASMTTVIGSQNPLKEIVYVVMRSVSVMELCLLAFLCVGMKALRISGRDLGFGIAMGFGVLTLNDLLHTALIHSSLKTETLQYIYEGFTLTAIGVWIGYAALPKRVHAPVLLPFRTMLFRWNEIAAAIGHKETRVLQPSPHFFLTDVEKIVDRAFERTFKGPTTEHKG